MKLTLDLLFSYPQKSASVLSALYGHSSFSVLLVSLSAWTQHLSSPFSSPLVQSRTFTPHCIFTQVHQGTSSLHVACSNPTLFGPFVDTNDHEYYTLGYVLLSHFVFFLICSLCFIRRICHVSQKPPASDLGFLVYWKIKRNLSACLGQMFTRFLLVVSLLPSHPSTHVPFSYWSLPPDVKIDF